MNHLPSPIALTPSFIRTFIENFDITQSWHLQSEITIQSVRIYTSTMNQFMEIQAGIREKVEKAFEIKRILYIM